MWTEALSNSQLSFPANPLCKEMEISQSQHSFAVHCCATCSCRLKVDLPSQAASVHAHTQTQLHKPREDKILKDVLRWSGLLDTHNYQQCDTKIFSIDYVCCRQKKERGKKGNRDWFKRNKMKLPIKLWSRTVNIEHNWAMKLIAIESCECQKKNCNWTNSMKKRQSCNHQHRTP